MSSSSSEPADGPGPRERVPPPAIRLVVGLGNPGRRYADTRHNVGFEAVEAALGDRPFRARMFSDGHLVESAFGDREIAFLRPMSYMNRSGGPVMQCVGSLGITPQEALVVLDEWQLPLGAIRTRRSGTDGGHNGLASILRALRTRDVPRMRLGIGAPHGAAAESDYVLSAFPEHEKEEAREMIERAGEAIRAAIESGIETAMNRYNRAPAPAGEEASA